MINVVAAELTSAGMLACANLLSAQTKITVTAPATAPAQTFREGTRDLIFGLFDLAIFPPVLLAKSPNMLQRDPKLPSALLDGNANLSIICYFRMPI